MRLHPITTLALTAGLTVGAALLIAPTAGAQAQPTTTPTTPCAGCGPAPGTLPPGTPAVWVFTEHRCAINSVGVNASNFNLVYGVTAAYPHPVQFKVTIDDKATAAPLVSRTLATLAPGVSLNSGTIVTVLPNTTIEMKVTGTDTVTGAPVRFGNDTFTKTSELTCDCVQPPTTSSTGPLSPPSSVTPPTTPVATTTPSDSPPSSAGTTGSPSTLPTTGSSNPVHGVLAALGLAAVGLVLVGVGRARRGVS